MWTQRFIARTMWAFLNLIPEAVTYNIRGVAPYWRVAWQQLTPKTQYEFGAYGMHMESTPGAVVGLEDGYTDWAVDFQIDRTLFRKDVLSLRGTYIRENSDFGRNLRGDGSPSRATTTWTQSSPMPNTISAIAFLEPSVGSIPVGLSTPYCMHRVR